MSSLTMPNEMEKGNPFRNGWLAIITFNFYSCAEAQISLQKIYYSPVFNPV